MRWAHRRLLAVAAHLSSEHDPVEQVVQIPFFQDSRRKHCESSPQNRPCSRSSAGNLISQHNAAEHVFFLISGSLQSYIRFHGVDDLLVGTIREPGALLGWSAFRQPHRYTATIRCGRCQGAAATREVIMKLVETQPRLGYLLLKRVAAVLANRLEQTRDILVRPEPTGEMPSSGA